MGATARGFPYPESSDPIAQGANAIKALAQAVEAKQPRLWSGLVSVTVPANTAAAIGTVTFPLGTFTGIPQVVALPYGAATWLPSVSSASATGCGITLITRTGSVVTTSVTVSVHVIAMQMP